MAMGLAFNCRDITHEVSLLAFRIALVFVLETLRDKTPDPGSQNPVRHEIPVDQRFVPGGLGLRDGLPGGETGGLH